METTFPVGAIFDGSLVPAPHPTGALAPLLLVPLLGAVLSGFAGDRWQRRLGRRVPSIVGVTAMVVASALAVFVIAVELLPLPRGERVLHQTLWPLFSIAGVEVTFGLTLDSLSAVMILIVTGVGTLIHVYAAGYMKDEPSLGRFFAFLNLFVAAMLLLVLADGFVPLLFGWEGVGLCSYFLIGFWFRRPAAADAATKAFVVNRFGDWGLLLGVCLLVWGLGSTFTEGGARPLRPRQVLVDTPGGAGIELKTRGERPRAANLREVPVGATLGFRGLAEQLTLEYGPAGQGGKGINVHGRPLAEALAAKRIGGVPLLFVVCLLLFMGAAGKSAQAPLFAWLPDAMAGPTPVSALIHAATMVTAGVYLLARLGFLFALSPGASTVAAVVGTATALIGASAGCLQWDLKRVLAFSTVSQLGLMFAAAGAGVYWAGIFHVLTHAFFKACLFLAAGSIIHAANHIESGESSDPQDLRNMGGLARALPQTRWGYLIACCALAGFPFASGFYSKDQIFVALAGAAVPLRCPPLILVVLVAGVTALTSFYLFRSYYLIFYGREQRQPSGDEHEPSRRMTAVVLMLAAGSLVVGPLLGWPRGWHPGHALPLMETTLAPVFAALSPPSAVSLAEEWGLQAASVVLSVAGFAVARVMYHRRLPRGAGGGSRVARWIASGWGFDALYRELAIRPARDFARAAAALDRRIFDPAVEAVARAGVTLARVAGALDQRIIDGAVNGVAALVMRGGRGTARLQRGRIAGYVVTLVAGVAAIAVIAYTLSQ